MTIRLVVLSTLLLAGLVSLSPPANAQKVKSVDKTKSVEKQDDSGGMPNALQGFSRNKNEPVKIESNKLEVRDKEKLAIFSGNVFVQQGDTTMRCPELRVFYEGEDKITASVPKTGSVKNTGETNSSASTIPSPEKTSMPVPSKTGKSSTTESNVQSRIKKLEALGGVIVNSKDQKATGDRADFEMKANIIVMTGNVVVTQGQNVMKGDRLVVDLNSSRAHMEAGSKGVPGRVQGLFVPSDKDEKNKDGAKPKDKKDKNIPTQ
jgi:lipopolysaccharide export system protein LptA